MTGCREALLSVLLLGVAPDSLAETVPGPPSAPRLAFRLFAAPPALATDAHFLELEPVPEAPQIRLAGDPDSVVTLGGPSPSGQPSLRLAVEVNEVIPKLLAPDPKVDSNDARGGRGGGDWKPLDAAGRPYQLRFGARLIW